MKYEVLAVGAPLMDHLLRVSESYLATIPGVKWGMETVNYEEIVHIVEKSGVVPIQIAGGSAANVIKGLAGLGRRCAMVGKIGEDVIGERVKNDLQDKRVFPILCYSSTPTGHVACLITPDGKRTCRAYPGASLEMQPENLDPSIFSDVKLVHVEGYTLLCPKLTQAAFEMAKKSGSLISFDLASFEIVKANRQLILDLLPQYVDVVFGNEQEALALTSSSPKESCEIMKKLCPIAVVMMGREGCWVGGQYEQIKCQARSVTPVDTTGAGDLFASGFLHQYLAGKSLLECAQLGTILASEVIQVVGAEIPSETWERSKILNRF
ncbi:MAG TPA: adenosine kinase [Waddliaceae bacterium]